VDAFSASDPLPPGPLPYADITNPQSLNKYTYTYNNPLKYVDPHGHDVIVDSSFHDMVRKLVAQSPTLAAELKEYAGSDQIHLRIREKTRAEVGKPRGHARVELRSDGTMTVDVEVRVGDEETLEHEVGHASDARTNTEQSMKDAATARRTRGGPNEQAHDDQPQEKRANAFKAKVEQEKKAHKKKLDEEKKRQKEEERQRKQQERQRRRPGETK
jgi:hypothetical protein